MKILIVGLGSMGKRRIRCLQALGYDDVVGFDPRSDRREEAKIKYKVNTISDYNLNGIDALIVSTPPDLHTLYLKTAVDNKIPAFAEVSVILDHALEIYNYNNEKIFIAPSCTWMYHPMVQEIKAMVCSGKYGKVANFTYHCGQYLPDWHPWENVKDFYVSKRETGACREIVPFELTWLVDIFGYPQEVKGFFTKTMDVEADIEDTYAFSMRFDKNAVGSVIVDVASRFATRSLILNMEFAQLRWNWEDKMIRVYETKTKEWVSHHQPESQAATGYNQNILEEIYVNELKSFFEGIQNPASYPNSVEKDIKILELVYNIENSDGGFLR